MEARYADLEPVPLSRERAAALAAHCVHAVTIVVGRDAIAVRFSRASAARAFAERFGDLSGTAEPSADAYAYDDEREAMFWFSPHDARRWPHSIADVLLVFFADLVAMKGYLRSGRDAGLHAAVIANADGVAALVGRSTAGKSTTSVAAVRRGFSLYSDERCIFQDGLVVPFLRAVTIREGGRKLLIDGGASDPAFDERLRSLPSAAEAQIRPSALAEALAGGPPRRLDALFAIAGHEEEPAIEATSLASVLPDLLRSMTSADTGLERAARIMRELRRTSIFRLTLGTPDASALAIAATLRDLRD